MIGFKPARWCLLSVCLAIAGCLSSGGSGSSSSRPDTPPTPPTLAPSPTHIEAVGIGVTNLEAAVTFYRTGLGMREIRRLARDNRTEVIMESADRRGSHIQLMQFNDGVGRNYQQNPGKLVFYVHDAQAFAARFQTAGGRVTLPPSPVPDFDNALVGFGRDPDNNLIEMVEVPSLTDSYLAAIGIGVSGLEQARTLYVEALGLDEQEFLSIPGMYDEYILQSPVPGSSALVLMHWTNDSAQNYEDNPVKLQLGTADPQVLAERLAEAGADVLQEPAATDEADLAPATVGYATDLDGTLLEVRQSIRSALGAAGIGVEDLQVAEDFYTSGLGMRVVERRSRADREELVLESADASGSQVVLTEFTDGTPRNMRRNPGKLVFYVKDMAAYIADFTAAGGRITLPPVSDPVLGVTVGFGRDIYNNLIEMVEDTDAEHSYFGAFGIGVSDLDAARAFYVDQLGFRQLLYLPIPGMYNEYILQGYGGSALVLMNWTNGSPQNYQDNPVKLEVLSIAPAAFTEALERAGGTVEQAPAEDDSLDGKLVGYGADLDGTVLEVQQAEWGLD